MNDRAGYNRSYLLENLMDSKSSFIFRIIIGALFMVQYFLGFDGHGHGAGNIITLLFGIVFAGYGCIGLIQRTVLIKKAKTDGMINVSSANSSSEVCKTVKPSFIFCIIVGLLMGSQYFLGFDGRGHGTGNIVLLLLGITLAGFGVSGLIKNAGLIKKPQKTVEPDKGTIQ
jgi:hypothetical protein